MSDETWRDRLGRTYHEGGFPVATAAALLKVLLEGTVGILLCVVAVALAGPVPINAGAPPVGNTPAFWGASIATGLVIAAIFRCYTTPSPN